MIKMILFDLDGTLLPMDQDTFIDAYLSKMAKKLAPHGYDPALLVKAIWKGTGAMVTNDGSTTNEEVFWKVFSGIFGRDTKLDEPLFMEYYENEFQTVAQVCGFDARAKDAIREIKGMGYRTALATNPLFPAIATLSRIRWAGLEASDFELITTYENSRHCKPNPEYYRDILEILNLKAADCLMVGNDVGEDMIAEQLGMKVFLLTDNLINKHNVDISRYPQGSFPELLSYIRTL